MSKQYISFCLYGTSRLYNEGAIINAKLASVIYPEWDTVFYVSETAPALKELQDWSEVVVVPHIDEVKRSDTDIKWHKDPNARFMDMRYRVLDRPDCERAIFRDVDARLSLRERDAVHQWMQSGMLGLCIYDCEHHWNGGVAPGLAGLVGGIYKDVQSLMDGYFEVYQQSGQPEIFYDIHMFRDLFITPIEFSVMRAGYGTDIPLTKELPPGFGRVCGDVVNPEWRNEKYEPTR